jgi:hypothetical protein
MKTILKKLIPFTAQEYQKGNLVFFHGQNAQWAYLERWLNALEKRAPSKDFVRIRSTGKTVSHYKVHELRVQGITNSKDEDLIFPASLHVLTIGCDSCPLVHTAGNYDHVARGPEIYLENIFKTQGLY